MNTKSKIRTAAYRTQNTKSGFTFIESLIAISVLLLSVTGPLTIAARGLVSASFARDQITAFYLAQEATELIRNLRDNNAIQGVTPWTTGMDACFGATGCYTDASTDTFTACPGGGCPFLTNNETTGVYAYTTGTGWDETKFRRTITATNINDVEMSVSVTISWTDGRLSKSFTTQENFLDW